MTAQPPLTAADMQALLDEHREAWAGKNITATLAGAEILLVGEAGPIAVIVPSDRFPHLIEWRAHLRPGWTVPYPAGFMPPDPLYAQSSERRRWLPTTDPYYPTDAID
jgi:hypothetical protein